MYTGQNPNLFFLTCWKVLAPLCILVIWTLNWYAYEPVTYGNYVFPLAAQIFGWIIALISLLAIPLGALHTFIKTPGKNFIQVN